MNNFNISNSELPWVQEIDLRFKMGTSERRLLSLDLIIEGFKISIEGNSNALNPKELAILAGRIKVLSKEQLSDFSVWKWLGNTLSCFRNICLLGIFKNSAEIGLKLSESFLEDEKRLVEIFKYVERKQVVEQKKGQDSLVDQKFLCDQRTFEDFLPEFQEQMHELKYFDTSAFLRGEKCSSSEVVELNDKILKHAMGFLRRQAKAVAEKKAIAIEDAYKLLIGFLDYYDDISESLHCELNSFKPQSTFVLRSAILLSSLKDGVGLQSWMVYTKSGKPEYKDIWPFLDNWKNWVPEAQGAMAKFAEKTFIAARELSKRHSEKAVILLKGGFGAGKTRFGLRWGAGISAPDEGKNVIRQAMASVPHSAVHVQGSQIAYKLFDEMIKKVQGTVIYDSSLSLSKDAQGYLEKSRQANKKMVIYDIARHDMARVLSVLKRDVKGKDPRIPPHVIIQAAIKDKLNRVECMKVVFEAKVEKDREALEAEYHLIAGDAQGWNTEELFVLTPGKIRKVHDEMRKRLELEKIEIIEPTEQSPMHTIRLTTTKEELEAYFAHQFKLPVKAILQDLSPEEQKMLKDTFTQRKLDLDISRGPIHDALTFYEALSENVKTVLPKKAVEDAFASLKDQDREAFFHSIQTKSSICYLDLPLVTALIIHEKLEGDPWS